MKKEIVDVMNVLNSLTAYDISPVFETNMPGYWNNPPCWIIDDVRQYHRDGYYCQTLVLGEHIGAHIDAPAHIHEGAPTIDTFAPGHFIAPYKKFDVTSYNLEAGDIVTVEMIKEVEERDGISVDEGDVILFRFGWDKYYLPDNPSAKERNFYGSNSPGLSEDACKYFLEKKIKAIGSDTCQGTIPFIDGKPAVEPPPCHAIYFLPNNIAIAEGLTKLGPIPTEGLFVAAPMNIKNGSGSPVSPVVFG